MSDKFSWASFKSIVESLTNRIQQDKLEEVKTIARRFVSAEAYNYIL